MIHAGRVSAQTLPAPSPVAPRSQIAGTITAAEAPANQISFKTDKGDALTINITEKTVIIHLPAGETDVKKGTRMVLSNLGVGDRIVAFVQKGADEKTLQATSMVVRTKADLDLIAQKDQEDWKKRGTTGNVAAIDAAAKTVTIKVGPRTLTVQPSDKTEYHRYSPDSAKFSDAKPSNFGEIRIGDEMRVLGNKSEDGANILAEKIVAGAFRQLAATIVSIDAAAGEVKVKDLASKQSLTVRVDAGSTMKKLPETMARTLARRYGPGAAGDTQGGAGGQRGGGAAVGLPPSPGAPGGGRRGGGGGDIGAMLDSLPPMTLSELKPGDAVMVKTTQGSDPSRVTATMLLAGVEPILTAAPTATRDIMSGWNLGGGGGDTGQ